MATATVSLQVQTPMELETMSTGYIAQGYVIANRTPTSITLVKRKEFSITWLVIGFFLCLIPLLIYLIVYAAETDKMVVISLGAPAQQGSAPYVGGAYGTPQLMGPPTGAPRSPDGNYWWDGQAWQPVQAPATGSAPLYGAPSAPYNPSSSPYSQPYGSQPYGATGQPPYPGASGPYAPPPPSGQR